jgi:hypothetical protein
MHNTQYVVYLYAFCADLNALGRGLAKDYEWICAKDA